jgi:hypothetical protein
LSPHKPITTPKPHYLASKSTFQGTFQIQTLTKVVSPLLGFFANEMVTEVLFCLHLKLIPTYCLQFNVAISFSKEFSLKYFHYDQGSCTIHQHYSQQPSFGNPDVLQLMNGSRNCGIYTQGSITQP